MAMKAVAADILAAIFAERVVVHSATSRQMTAETQTTMMGNSWASPRDALQARLG